MSECAFNKRAVSLPYAILITRFLKWFGINLDGETAEPINSVLGSKYFALTGAKVDTHGKWIKTKGKDKKKMEEISDQPPIHDQESSSVEMDFCIPAEPAHPVAQIAQQAAHPDFLMKILEKLDNIELRQQRLEEAQKVMNDKLEDLKTQLPF